MLPELIELPEFHLLEVRQLLKSAGLPFDDVREPGRRFYRLELAGAPVGWAGLEPYGPDALLRSVVVLDQMRGRQHGRLLVSAIAAQARTLGAERLWLLTTTAVSFFAKLGFDTVRRDAAPPALQDSREFASLCPASAICMMLDLSQAQEDR
jgi:amino-acid N-acetyltransferase